MNIFLTTMVIIMFVIVPMLKLNEKKHIEKITKDNIMLEIKEDVNIKNSFVYIIIGLIILFCLPIGEHGLYMTFLKVMTVIGLYFMEEEMRTRYYLGNKGIYEIKRFKNKSLMNLRRLSQNEVFRISAVPNKDLIYRIYFHTQTQQAATTKDIRIEDKEDLQILKSGLEDLMGLYIEKPNEESQYLKDKREKEEKIFKTINDLLAKALVAVGIFVVVKEIFFMEETTLTLIIAKILAYSYLPMIVYLGIMMFARKQFKLLKKSKKDYFTVAIVTSLLLPITTIVFNGPIEAQRFIVVHVISIVTITLLLIMAYAVSKLLNIIKEGTIIKGMENIFNKAHGKNKSRN